MRDFLLRVVVFSILSLVCYPSFLFITKRLMPPVIRTNDGYCTHANHATWRMLQEIGDRGKVDVLFVGSSHVYRGYDVRIFERAGMKAFNMGTSAQTPVQSLYLMKKYLDLLDPELLVLDVWPEIFAIDGVESSLDLLSLEDPGKEEWQLMQHHRHLKVTTTWVDALVHDLLGSEGCERWLEPIEKDVYVKGGFVERKLEYYVPGTGQKNNIRVPYREDQFEALEEIIDMARERDIRVLLVFTPVSKELYGRYTGLEEFGRRMSALAPYVDFNQRVDLVDSLHFYDDNHMNQRGVERFDAELIGYLREDWAE